MKSSEKFAATSLAVMASLTLAFVYLLFFEEPYLTYTNLPFDVLEPEVAQGGLITLKVARCNSTSQTQTYTLARSLQNLDAGDYVVLQDSLVQVQPGCTEAVSLANKVPAEVTPGLYRIIGLAMVDGTIRSHKVFWYSKPFRVVRSKQ
jgi:hypothetical protein